MSVKRVIVGQSAWTIADDDTDTPKAIKAAMENGTVAELQLVNDVGHAVLVYLNGKIAETVVVDLGEDAKPSEIS